MQWLNIFYCFINYHFGFIYFLKIANWRQKGKYKNNSAIFLSPKMLQPIILETTLNFIFGLQLSSKWSPNGLLFTSKVVSIWSPMETFSSLPISSQPCLSPCGSYLFFPVSDSQDKNCRSIILAEVTDNIKQLLEGHTEGNILFILISLVSFFSYSVFLMLIFDFYTWKKIV